MITINLIDDILDKQFKKRWERYDQEANEYAVRKMKEQISKDAPKVIIGILLGMVLLTLISLMMLKANN